MANAGKSEEAGAEGVVDGAEAAVAGGDAEGAARTGGAAVVGGSADENAGEDAAPEGAAVEDAIATCGGAGAQATQRTPRETRDGAAMPAMRRAP